MDAPSNNEAPNSGAQPNKKRKKKSVVWDHFTVEPIDAHCTRALCNQCKRSFAYITGAKLAGTSHLKRHISLGICPFIRVNQEKNQTTSYDPSTPVNGFSAPMSRPKKRHRANPGITGIPFDQDYCNLDIARMIIQHDYPLDMVEQLGFINFARSLQPRFNSLSTKSMKDKIESHYLTMKQDLLNIITVLPGRINLAIDLWTSDRSSSSYVILSGFFVDQDWKLNRRLLNVIMAPLPDSEDALDNAVAYCLADWSCEGRLFNLTVDQSIANETVRGILRRHLSIKNPLILNGQLILGSCYAHILSTLAWDALCSMRELIDKVRQSVKYVTALEAPKEKFIILKQQLQVPSVKSLIVDDQTKWNTTYQMLMAASEQKEVFSCLDTSDPYYRVTISLDEWKRVETLCTYLKFFYDAAEVLATSVCPTSNTFYHDVWKIQLELMHAVTSDDPFVSALAKPLQEKFDRYWKDCNLVLAIAVIMDPRFKMKLVEFSFTRIYGEDTESWIRTIDEGLHELYLDYVVQSLPPPTFLEEGNDTLIKTEISQEDGLLVNIDALLDCDVYLSGFMSSQHTKSELDQYLEESLLPRIQDFDVLGWWRLNRAKYPTLSKMACDILSIPVSTASPDSVFDTVKRNLDSSKSSLSPATIQSLFCARDWLQFDSSGFQPERVVKAKY